MKKILLISGLIIFMAVNVFAQNRSPSDSVGMGTKAVTTAGTAVVLSATSEVAKDLIVTAYSTNSGLIYVGNSTVDKDAKLGGEITAGKSYVIPYCNVGEVYIDSTVNGEGVTFTYTR